MTTPTTNIEIPARYARTVTRRVPITAELIDNFVRLSGDDSAIHVDDRAARERGFRGRVAHGMLLGSLVSALVGTELPGDAGVLQQVRLSFRNPCYVGDVVEIELRISEYVASVRVLILDVVVRNQHGVAVATGKIQSGVAGDE
jgi:3-hydroxybutyryl-CoA dehydratase